jgi:hypothetical protein
MVIISLSSGAFDAINLIDKNYHIFAFIAFYLPVADGGHLSCFWMHVKKCLLAQTVNRNIQN